MNRKLALIIILLLAIMIAAISQSGIKPSVKSETLPDIKLPDGFRIDVFAENMGGSPVSYPGPNPGPRMMLLKDGVLFVTVPNMGRVVACLIEMMIKKPMRQ